MRNTILTCNVRIDSITKVEAKYEGITINPVLRMFLDDNQGMKIHCNWGEYYILTDLRGHWYLYNSNCPWWDAFLALQCQRTAPYVAVQEVEWVGDYGMKGSGLRIIIEDDTDEIVHDVIVY